MASKWNTGNNSNIIQDLENELGPQSTLYWLLISICGAIVWTVYLTYYNSRVLGLILTAVINRFVPRGHVKFGSFSLSVLSGKVMFRDVHFITEDYSVRAQLGFAIFRWWRPLTDKDITEDLSHSETRLSIYLDSFELHVYNRSANYQRLEKLFGLDKVVVQDAEESPTEKTQTMKLKANWEWRDLIPVIKIEVSSGRLVFGNYLIPQSLSVNFGDAHIVYTTKPASTPFDQFMHIVKCKADNIRIMAIPSPKYSGKVDEPPRCMGDGFVVLQSNDVDIYYYQDEPGLVPYEPEMVQLANGDVIAVRTWPCWGMDVKCGKNTDVSYGPWADRQREFLWHFFYPPDYQPTMATVLPDPGQLRVHRSFDFKMSMQNAVTVDILFTKNKETQAVHMNCKQGSYLEFTIPYVIDDSGYVTKVTGQLMHVDMSTSLKFRSLLECETLECLVEIKYPQNWNDHQNWNVELTACKASGYLILHHKAFFIDLIEDWSSKVRPDILHFVPYTWHVSILLKEFELMTLTNEWNWIDCFGATPENAHLAVCGDTFDLTFDLPFIDYLPKTVLIKFFIRGESAEARMYLPETNTSRHIVIALSENMKLMGRDGTVIVPVSGGQTEKKWRKVCQKSDGWVDVWTTPIAALSIGYVYHPMPPTGNEAGSAMDESLDLEETLLIPVRLVPLRPLRPKKNRLIGLDYGAGQEDEFDRTKLAADQITVEIEIGPSVCYAYGSLVRNFLHLKENYFGEDIKFTDFEQKNFSGTKRNSVFEHVITLSDVKEKPFDPRRYRPLHVRVLLMLHDVQAHLVKNCTEDGPQCPCVFLERLVFEMDKRYEETKLQVFLSPALLICKDLTQRPPAHDHLQDGHLTLSGLQIRGHAMFSHEGLPLDSETLEYAWLFELTIGDLTGRLTAPQLQNIVEFLQTLLYLVQDPENVLMRPVQDRLCQHMVLQSDCKQQPDSLLPCPTADDIKYRITRLSVDCVDVYLVESGSALNVQVFPVRVSTCNLHSHSTKLGATVLIPEMNIKQFVLSVPVTQVYDSDAHMWLEAGGVSLGPIVIDAVLASPNQDFLMAQQRFLRLHDKRTQRLTFLWPSEVTSSTPQVCGCLGGCQFFGSNRNGPTFFNPSHQDFVNSTNASVLNVCTDGTYYGYGQSILQPNQLVFDQQTLSAPHSRKKGGVPPRRMRSDDDRDQTLTRRKEMSTDEAEAEASSVPSGVSTLVDWDRNEFTVIDTKEDFIHSWDKTESGMKLFRLSSVQEKDVETGSITSGVPSEYLPGVAMPDAYDTDQSTSSPSDVGKMFASSKQGSVSSLAEGTQKSLLPLQLGHERKRSYEPPKTFTSEKASPEVAERSQKHGSRGSLISAGAGVLDIHSLSHHSSLTSPVLRRLSSQLSMQNDASLTSIGTSDRFFSATEDASSSAASLPKNIEKARRAVEISRTLPGQSAVDFVPGLHSGVRSPDSDAQSSSLASFYDNAAEFHPAESSTDADSFVSACSSRHLAGDEFPIDAPLSSEDDVTCVAEDDESLETDATQIPFAVNYIDLHGQINQPITKSPLLMSCYMNHMTQLHCSSWSSPVRQPNGSTVSPNGDSTRTRGGPPVLQSNVSCIPEFSYLHEGFTTNLMVGKRLPGSPSTPSSNSSASGTTSRNNYDFPSASETLPPSSDGCPESKMTAVVNLKGSVDIMISPLMLEALQRYLEAVTPVLASLSPSTIVDSLHFKCTSSVEEQNRRKRKRHASSSDSTEKKDDGPVLKKDKGRHHHHQPPRTATKDVHGMRPEATAAIDWTERKSKGSRLQVIFFLSKINVCILQASLVEETISISALERARELTCVSVLAASIDSIHLQLLTNSVLQSPSADATPSGSGADAPGSGGRKQEPSSPKTNSLERDVLEGDQAPLEAHLEDVVGSLNVARIHFQLRRMKKHSNYSDSIFLTVIPEHRSKVLFTFQKQPAPLYDENQMGGRLGGGPTRMETFPQTNEPGNSVEDIAGFIMFECGMENINLKAARRDGYNAKMNEERFQNVAKILHDIEIEAKGTQGKYEMETSSLAMRLQASCVPEGCLTKEHESQRDSDLISLQSAKSWADGNTADDEASWKSRLSHRSTSSVEHEENNATQSTEKLRGDASSCVLEFKTVWFNFAAPPPSPRKRKLEYTRNDWNLLSTATPAINSWMNPCHRAMLAASCLHNLYNKRVCAVMACIMTDALEMQGIHMPVKSKYNRITRQSKMLQEDPSCQLLTVLRRYIHRVGVQTIEENQHDDTLPQLWTVKKGILVLTRQWKNVLYMPMLANSNFKTKKKVAVTFAIPLDSGMDSLQTVGGAVDDGEGTLDNFEVIDEKTSLLKAEGGSVQKTGSIHKSGSVHGGPTPSAAQSPLAVASPPAAAAGDGAGAGALSSSQVIGPVMDTGTESIDSRLPKTGVAYGKSGQKSHGSRHRHGASISSFPAHFSLGESPIKQTEVGSSQFFPATSGGGSATYPPAPPASVPANLRPNTSHQTFSSGSTKSSSEHMLTASMPSTPLRQSLTRHLTGLDKREDEDMYRWMQRQQEFTRVSHHPTGLQCYPSMGQESWTNTGISDLSQDDSLNTQRVAAMARPAFQLADAQVLFKPLLRAMGLQLETVHMSAMMKKFGGDVSITGILNALRVEIVDSEANPSRKSTMSGRGKLKQLPKFLNDKHFGTPAFLCDTFAVMLSMKDIIDFEKDKEKEKDKERDCTLTEGLSDSRQKSLNALKLALDQIEAKPTTTKVNFNVNCQSITQHVNMSLLRLVHQFVTMIENIFKTQLELKDDPMKSCLRQAIYGTNPSATSPSEAYSAKMSSGAVYHSTDASGSKADRNLPEASHLKTTEASGIRATGLRTEKTQHPSRRPDHLPSLVSAQPGQSPDKPVKGHHYSSVKAGAESQGSGVQSPLHSINLSDSIAIEMADTSSPAVAEKTIVDEIKENTPKCWRTLYHLLDLYSMMPTMKTVVQSRLSDIEEEPDKVSESQSMPFVKESTTVTTNVEVAERQPLLSARRQLPPKAQKSPSVFTQSFMINEKIPLVVFGVAKVQRIHISAHLSGLKLEAELQGCQASATHREKVKGLVKRKSTESSATLSIGHTMIVLLEGIQTSMQTVVTVNIGKSQGLYSSFCRRSAKHNSGLLTIGVVSVDIPQHPVALHTMVVHSSKRLSTTLQEFIKLPSKIKAYDVVDMGVPPAQQPSNQPRVGQHPPTAGSSATDVGQQQQQQQPQQPAHNKAKPIVIHFKAQLQGLTIGASLLPSLKAQYKIGEVTSSGITGAKARFTIDLPTHSLSFSSRLNVPSSLPSSASIDLPPIHIFAEYRQHDLFAEPDPGQNSLAEGLTLLEGSYLKAVADVGAFEHILTTDLLNHLVFVQKVFMKEVNEVVQKVSGVDQPVPLWGEDMSSHPERLSKPLLYSFLFRLKGIQITATTPTMNAVRLETSVIELELSNRIQRANRSKAKDEAEKLNTIPESVPKGAALKVFIKAQVDLNLALGTIIKNPMFEEAESEFQHLASFQTRITLRNALQDEMIPGVSKDQEALLIALKRPIIFVLPAAFDKAVLVWLNYKNAYEYWNEQRMALNKEVQMATEQVLVKLPLSNLTQTAVPALGTLFLQLTVDDLGMCLPMNPFTQSLTSTQKIDEPGAALVLTLESTQISACSYGSLVSKGKFTGFCLRFADDFQVSWDDWKPDKSLEVVMNALVVPHGTYEVCSRTLNAPRSNEPHSNAKWILNILWQMRGIDIHLDTNIGKRLSAIGSTLTTLAGDQFDDDADGPTEDQLPSVKVEPPSRKQSLVIEGLPDFVYDSSLDSKTRARLIEKEMNEQAKLVQDLHQLRASKNTIEEEERKLHELQAALFHDFRQDIMKKLKRQSVKASAIKDKLGLGNKPQHSRSHSTGVTAMRGLRRRDGKAPMARYTSCDTGPCVRHFPGHSRTVSIDTAELPSATGTPEVFLPGSSHPGQRFNFPADAFGFPEEDSTPSSPNVSNDTPVSIERTLIRTQDLSDSTSDSELGEQQFIAPRRATAKTNISTVTPPLCNTPEETQRQKVPPSPGATMAPSISSASTKMPMEPSVDFELDVKVGIDSGKCVLHPKEPKTEADPDSRRSASSKGHPPVSPKLIERKKSSAKKLVTDSATISSGRALQTHLSSNITIFFLPGVDVKVHYVCQPDTMDQLSELLGGSQVHYNSKMSPHGSYESPTTSSLDRSKLDSVHPSNINEDVTDAGQPGLAMSFMKKASVKKANLYAWLSLQQLPEEMLISPALLDFLEQAIEPIPKIQLVSLKGYKNISNRTTVDLDTSATSLVSSSNYAYSSFPVDVVVYIRVQPSLVRFTCLPVSRVECLLRMPSLDVVFSTKKADVEANAISDSLPPSKVKGSASQVAGTLPSRTSNASRSHLLSAAMLEASVGGGLSVTACLNDFSLYIFHPYGGGQKKASLSVLENTFRKGAKSTTDALSADEKGTPHLETSRKDSLSLNVEFVKVNISRSRRGLMQSDLHLSSASSATKLTSDLLGQKTAANSVRFSAVCDIGSASFKYDMRRLLEILAFPKAWYRRSLARRMFLGEELALLDSDLESDVEAAPTNLSSSSPTSESSLFTAFNKVPSARSARKWHVEKRAAEDLPTGAKDKSQGGIADQFSPIPSIDVQSPFQDPVYPGVSSAGAATSAAKSITNWETLVLFAVNLSQLDVVVNMSNVMGNTTWSTKELKSQGRLSIDSRGYKNMKILAGLGGSKLDARGGIIGGNIELQGLNFEVCISEDPGREPEHVITSQLHIMETRLDYMGSSILIGRISDLAVKVSDEWQVEACHRDDKLRPPLTNRSVIIFVHGDLSWDKFHLMISRSTTPDLIKMAHKLEEFITQQRTSSKRVLSAFGPMSSGSKAKMKQKDEDSWISEIRHHRHWQKVLEHLSGCKMSMFSCTLPDHDTVIGGTMSLQGKNISLACFHGINFRSKSWALFTMDEPYICFATEAADIDDSGAKSTHIVQNLSFQLGHNMTEMTEKRQMAMICKLSRGHYMPPPFTSVQEWFHYSFATTEHKDLDSFPTMVRLSGDGASDPHRQTTRRLTEYTHDTEIIFILPSLQMHLKTEHLQGEHEPQDDDPKPVVECSFVTEFEDHIFVAMDAEAVLFVHDLVINYVKEKDKGSAKVPKSPEAEKQKLENPTSVLKQDFRDFDCKTWHLEPTVRLLSWAGKRIDPVGVDYILQKLGFQHARLTIPKWMQRGCMDPLDKILSVLVKKLVTALKEQEQEEKHLD